MRMAGINFINSFYSDISKMLKAADPSITDDQVFEKLALRYFQLDDKEKSVLSELEEIKSSDEISFGRLIELVNAGERLYLVILRHGTHVTTNFVFTKFSFQ